MAWNVTHRSDVVGGLWYIEDDDGRELTLRTNDFVALHAALGEHVTEAPFVPEVPEPCTIDSHGYCRFCSRPEVLVTDAGPDGKCKHCYRQVQPPPDPAHCEELPDEDSMRAYIPRLPSMWPLSRRRAWLDACHTLACITNALDLPQPKETP